MVLFSTYTVLFPFIISQSFWFPWFQLFPQCRRLSNLHHNPDFSSSPDSNCIYTYTFLWKLHFNIIHTIFLPKSRFPPLSSISIKKKIKSIDFVVTDIQTHRASLYPCISHISRPIKSWKSWWWHAYFLHLSNSFSWNSNCPTELKFLKTYLSLSSMP